MSLSSLAEREHDKDLKVAFQNSFSLLTDRQIYMVCDALANMSTRSAAAAVIEIVGEEEGRVAALLPRLIAPATLTDADIAAKAIVGFAKVGADKPSLTDAKRTVDALAPNQAVRADAHLDLEKVAGSAFEWGIIARTLGEIALALGTKVVPELRFATTIPRLLRWGSAAVGAVGGGASDAFRQLMPADNK